MKAIYFLADAAAIGFVPQCDEYALSYDRTGQLISEGCDLIVTFSVSHLSLSLIEMGYEIWLCRGNRKLNIRPHMPEIERDLRPVQSIYRMFRAGAFDRALENAPQQSLLHPETDGNDSNGC